MDRLRGASLLMFSVVLSAAILYGQSTPNVAQTGQPASANTPVSTAKPSIPPPSGPPIPANAPRMTRQTRLEVIRDFETQLLYTRTAFPMGKKGLLLKDGVTTPNGQELQQLLALWGPALRPGDPARITYVQIKNDHIHFEINGGPEHRQKWWQRIEISGTDGADIPLAPNEVQQNPHGSYLDLYFDKYVPEMTAQQLRDVLLPAFDFTAHNKDQAYLDSLPPKVKKAIQDHYVMVGMNSEMVLHAKGKPPKKVREKDGDTEYEEWIYGEPPQDVDFVRFVGDEVVRVETMKVGGQKIVRTQREIILNKPAETEAKKEEEQRPANAPSLRRPGEDPANVPRPSDSASPMPPTPPPDIPQPQGGPDQLAVGRAR
jgi:hypothetical protein